MSRFIYDKEHQREISFPIGGIGTGSIGLAGNGLLVDWEIFNRPNKKSYNGYTHFSLKAESSDEVLDTRMLLGDYQGSLMGSHLRNGKLHSGYGFGPERMTLAGMPHFEECNFYGCYPFADIVFQDRHMPAEIKMTAFNPFIPSSEDDSSIPAAFFEFNIKNLHEKKLKFTLAFSVTNPLNCEKSLNAVEHRNDYYLVTMKPYGIGEGEADYGDLTIITDERDVSYQQYWYRGNRSDSLEMFWGEFTQRGKLKNRNYPENYEMYKGQGRNRDTGVLAVHFELDAGECKQVRFILSWNVPNVYNYWNPEKDGKKTFWKNYYAKLYENSKDSAVYAMSKWERLYALTRKFQQDLINSDMPEIAKEAVISNISILKTPTCLRLENGEFYGFEGCIEDEGCCEGSCSHVWNYAYALPFLFPKLERSMRDLEFSYNCDEHGKMSFRLQLPLGRERDSFNACVDGQFGSIFKIYREWKLSGDDEWLRRIWKKAKPALEYAWNSENEDLWDIDKSGVISGRQHHTLDMELFGPNSWLTGFYLLALKAAAEIAEYIGDFESSTQYINIFLKGKQWCDQNLFNGEYFVQKIQIDDKHILDPYKDKKALFGESVEQAYWNEDEGELKYQIGEGCLIDQVLAQWHSNLTGLGEIFDKEKVRSALRSVYHNNYYSNIREVTNTWRIYAVNDESGTIICSWPASKKKPAIPIPYNSEVMSGFEYQAGTHMIQEGLEEEGLEIIRSVRDRYDGKKRNPWNEIECGSNYARSMASYALLLSYSGFIYDMSEGRIGFKPLHKKPVQNYFWSVDGAWGNVSIEEKRVSFRVDYGHLILKYIDVPLEEKTAMGWLDGRKFRSEREEKGFRLPGKGIKLSEGQKLTLLSP